MKAKKQLNTLASLIAFLLFAWFTSTPFFKVQFFEYQKPITDAELVLYYKDQNRPPVIYQLTGSGKVIVADDVEDQLDYALIRRNGEIIHTLREPVIRRGLTRFSFQDRHVRLVAKSSFLGLFGRSFKRGPGYNRPVPRDTFNQWPEPIIDER